MNVKTAIESRRSVKAFDPAHRMSEAEVQELLGQAMLAPTAFNIQNWRFVVVADSALRQEIRKVAWDQSQVTDASLLLVLCADLKAWEKKPERYWRNVDAPVREFMVPAIHQYYVGKEQVQRDEAMRSCGLAGMALMLTAREMGTTPVRWMVSISTPWASSSSCPTIMSSASCWPWDEVSSRRSRVAVSLSLMRWWCMTGFAN